MNNRNALALVNLASAKTIGDGLYSYSGGYGDLVEKIGIDSSSTKISLDASEQVLEQTVARRNSISAVNLDEEAADGRVLGQRGPGPASGERIRETGASASRFQVQLSPGSSHELARLSRRSMVDNPRMAFHAPHS